MSNKFVWLQHLIFKSVRTVVQMRCKQISIDFRWKEVCLPDRALDCTANSLSEGNQSRYASHRRLLCANLYCKKGREREYQWKMHFVPFAHEEQMSFT